MAAPTQNLWGFQVQGLGGGPRGARGGQEGVKERGGEDGEAMRAPVSTQVTVGADARGLGGALNFKRRFSRESQAGIWKKRWLEEELLDGKF
jgi:hypothetical protein